MFTGTRTGNEIGGSYLKTGLSAFTFLGVNPTAQQIETWTGRDNVNEPNYDVTKDFSEREVRPINFWLKNADGVTVNFRINVGSAEAIAKSGNYQVCTTTGQVLWAKAHGAVKPELEDHKPLKVGEADLIMFIAKLINFDTKSGDNLYSQMAANKVDVDSLFKGDYSGMTKLAAAYSQNHVSMVLVVREKEALDASGSAITKHYQGVSSAPETWFSGEVTDWAKNKLLSRYEKSLEVGPGQTKAYPLIADLFTIEYMPFDKAQCFNNVPDNPEVATWQ